MFRKEPPRQLQFGLGFYLDARREQSKAEPACSCGKFKSWRRRPDGNEYCNGCGHQQGWEVRAKVAPPEPAQSSKERTPQAGGADSMMPSPEQMVAHRDKVFAGKLATKSAAIKVAKATNGGPRKGLKKAPPGLVWWVSAAWSEAEEQRLTIGLPPPAILEFTLEGMQLETGVGVQGTTGARIAYSKRESKRRLQAFLTTKSKCQQFVGWPVHCTLTRVSPGEFDDDNLGTAFKRIRDAICEALGFRDDKKRDGYLDWSYAQAKGGKRKGKDGPAVGHVMIRMEVMR